MGWNIDIDWTSADTVNNVPPFISASDIYDAFLERYKAINSPAITETPMLNGTVETLDIALRSLIQGGEPDRFNNLYSNFVDIGSSNIGDFDNQAAVPSAWTISSLEAEIGTDLPTINGPLGAWAWWWYAALNLCTVFVQKLPPGTDLPSDLRQSSKFLGDTWENAIDSYNENGWFVGGPYEDIAGHWAYTDDSYYVIERWRIIIPGGSANSVHFSPNELYTDSYTMAVYNPMGIWDGDIYDNNDYDVDEGNFGLLYLDLAPTGNIDGKYQSDISIADFDEPTIDGPPTDGKYLGYRLLRTDIPNFPYLDFQRTLIDCGVSGGFSFT